MWLYHRVMSPNDADGMANSVDPDQTAPLIWVCTVCSGISVRKLRIITVYLHGNARVQCFVRKCPYDYTGLSWCVPGLMEEPLTA